jgi:hypothetical protein
MVPKAFPAIHTPASCHTPLPAWLQSPLLAQSGPERLGTATSAIDPKRTFECGYHPICNISHRFEFDPLESSHELLRVWGDPGFEKKSGQGGWRTGRNGEPKLNCCIGTN